MTIPIASLFDPSLDIIALAAVLVSLRYIMLQAITKLFDAKWVFVGVHALFAGLFISRIPTFFSSSLVLMDLFAIIATAVVLWVGILLVALGYVFYVRPPEETFRKRIIALFTKRLIPHGLAVSFFASYAVLFSVYVALEMPFTIATMTSWTGVQEQVPVFNPTFLAQSAVALGFFLGYSTLMFGLASVRSSDTSTRRASAVMAVGWGIIAVDLFLFRVYLVTLGIDAQGLGNVIIAGVFASFPLVFRRSSALAALFEPMKSVPAAAQSGTGSPTAVGGVFSEGAMLLEVDPSTAYEAAVRDFGQEQLSKGRLLFIFTSRSSPVWSSLHNVPEVRFFLMANTPYPRAGDEPLVVMVPKNDEAVLLNVIDETVTRNPQTAKAIVFDNISDTIMNFGFEDSLKFLKQANGILAGRGVPSLFLMLSGAHDERTEALTKKLFPAHLTFDGVKLRVCKA